MHNEIVMKMLRTAGDVPDIRSAPPAAAAGTAGLASPAPADSAPSMQHEGKRVYNEPKPLR